MYNPDEQVGVLNAVLANLGLDDINLDWGFLELHSGDWLSNPGVLDLGFAEIKLINLSLVIAADDDQRGQRPPTRADVRHDDPYRQIG
jgi:hypothetical protein